MGISFLSLICPFMICLKRKHAKKIKAKRIENALNMIASMSSRRCESYRMYLEDDSLYQTVIDYV